MNNFQLCSEINERVVQHFVHCIETHGRNVQYIKFLQTIVKAEGKFIKKCQDMVMAEVRAAEICEVWTEVFTEHLVKMTNWSSRFWDCQEADSSRCKKSIQLQKAQPVFVTRSLLSSSPIDTKSGWLLVIIASYFPGFCSIVWRKAAFPKKSCKRNSSNTLMLKENFTDNTIIWWDFFFLSSWICKFLVSADRRKVWGSSPV